MLRRKLSRALRRKIARGRIDAFVAQQASSALTLDLGCANSRYVRYFPNRVGIDIVEGRDVAAMGDAHNLPLAPGSFCVVLCTEMLEHVQDPQKTVDEIARVLEPGGKVILTTRFVFPIHEAPHDYFRYTKYGIQCLFRNWTAVAIQPDSGPFEAIGSLFQRMAYQSNFAGGRVVTATCLLIARLLPHADRLIRHEYGNSGRSTTETGIIAGGYLVTATKPSAAKDAGRA